MIPSLPASVIVASLMLRFSVCLPKLHLSWRLLKARTEVKLFNYSLALCLAVAGEGHRQGRKLGRVFVKFCDPNPNFL